MLRLFLKSFYIISFDTSRATGIEREIYNTPFMKISFYRHLKSLQTKKKRDKTEYFDYFLTIRKYLPDITIDTQLLTSIHPVDDCFLNVIVRKEIQF